MIVFRGEKRRKILDLYRNWFVEFFRFIESRDKVRCDLLLTLILGINSGRIVISDICKLSFSLSRIDLSEIEFHELLIGDETRIIDDLDGFTMLRASCTYFLIACIICRSSSISRDCFGYSYLSLEYAFHTPETSSCEIGFRLSLGTATIRPYRL